MAGFSFNPLTGDLDLIGGSSVPSIPLSEKGQPNGVATLDGAGKLPLSQLTVSAFEYLGNWNAATNIPALIDSTGNIGDLYNVSVAGTQNLGSGVITYAISDKIVYNGTIWEKWDLTDAVTSVNGQTGTVVLNAANVNASNQTLSNLAGPTSVNQDLIPDGTSTRKLGSQVNPWIEIYTPIVSSVNSALIVSTYGSTSPDTTGRPISILADANGLAPSVSGQPINIITGQTDATTSGAINIRTGAPINGGAPGGINLESGGPENSITIGPNAVGLTAGNGADLVFIQGSSIDLYGNISVSTVVTKYFNLEQDFSVGITAPNALAADYTITLPLDNGSLNQVLTTDGNGVTSWQTIKSPGDIQETSFSAANNQATPANVTGLSFANGTVRSFKALVSVTIDATADLYEVFELLGIQKGASWGMAVSSTGDASNVTFAITNAGQVTYTSGNEAGFVSSTFKFRSHTTGI